MFERSFNAKVKKFHEYKDDLSRFSVRTASDIAQVNFDAINVAVDKEEVYKVAQALVSFMGNSFNSPEVFSAAVAYICEAKGVEYKKYCGFAVPKDSPTYNKDVEGFNKRKSSGVEHPLFANHMYLDVEGTTYDLFRGKLAVDVNHLDCIEF